MTPHDPIERLDKHHPKLAEWVAEIRRAPDPVLTLNFERLQAARAERRRAWTRYGVLGGMSVVAAAVVGWVTAGMDLVAMRLEPTAPTLAERLEPTATVPRSIMAFASMTKELASHAHAVGPVVTDPTIEAAPPARPVEREPFSISAVSMVSPVVAGTATVEAPRVQSATKHDRGQRLAARAEKQLAAGQVSAAIRTLERLVHHYPQSSATRVGLLDLARLFARVGRPTRAYCTYATFLQRYPDSFLRPDVLRRQAQLFSDRAAPNCRL